MSHCYQTGRNKIALQKKERTIPTYKPYFIHRNNVTPTWGFFQDKTLTKFFETHRPASFAHNTHDKEHNRKIHTYPPQE